MNKDKAIQLLERLKDPEPYEPMLTKDAYDAIQMAIDALENQKSVCEEYCEYEDCEAEKMVVQSLSSLYPLKEFEEIAIDKVLDAVKQPKRIIHCKDCKHWIPYDWMFSEVWQSKNMADYPEDEIGCNYCDMAMKANDFCSRGERRTDG